MTKDEDFKLLKIQAHPIFILFLIIIFIFSFHTCSLRVNLHCDGCKHKVKKILQRIEGVYQVSIDAEQQKVTVSGSVDSATLIKKLVKAGKHAEVWSNNNQSQSQSQNQKGSCTKDDKKNKTQKEDFIKGVESIKKQQKIQPSTTGEDDDSFEDDEDLRFLKGKSNQLGVLRQKQQEQQKQQEAAANSANKAGNSKNKSQPNNGNGKKGQNAGGQKGNLEKLSDVKRVNELSSIMNNLVGGGGGGGGGGGFETPANGGMAMATGGQHMNMNGLGYNQHPQEYNSSAAAASMMMNLQNRQAMYQRSPMMPPTTGYYYYNYNPTPYPYNTAPYTYGESPHGYYYTNTHGGDHNMLSDENTSSCSIM
ncbi:hypothetical protein LXL04_011324 [Taraxacum kok-saghyz]